MRRSWLLILSFVLVSVSLRAQTSPSDSQTLQALLAEVRQLRKDLQSTTSAVQRAQILFYRLRVQEATVARASQRSDETRSKLAQTQSERKKLAADIKHSEDFVGNEQNPPADRKQIEDLLPQLRAKLESLASQEQQRQSDEIEAQEQLRAERTKLSELEEQLDRLQKALEHLGQLP